MEKKRRNKETWFVRFQSLTLSGLLYKRLNAESFVFHSDLSVIKEAQEKRLMFCEVLAFSPFWANLGYHIKEQKQKTAFFT